MMEHPELARPRGSSSPGRPRLESIVSPPIQDANRARIFSTGNASPRV